jgi:hypothetical protein
MYTSGSLKYRIITLSVGIMNSIKYTVKRLDLLICLALTFIKDLSISLDVFLNLFSLLVCTFNISFMYLSYSIDQI